MKSTENDNTFGSVTISALNKMYRRGRLDLMLMPELESHREIEAYSFVDFELMTDDERRRRIVQILSKTLNIDQAHDFECRERHLVEYRHLLAYLLRRFTGYSWSMIGDIMGHKNHATAIHAHKTVKNAIEWDKSYALKVERIIDAL